MEIRHKRTDYDSVARTWVYYDVQAQLPGRGVKCRGWVKIGEVGQSSHVGWSGTLYDGTPFGERYSAETTRGNADFVVVQAFEEAVRRGEVDPKTYSYPDAPTTRPAALVSPAARDAGAPALPSRRVESPCRYVLVADPGVALFAQVVAESDELADVEAALELYGPFEKSEHCDVGVAWTQGWVIRRAANPSQWGIPRPPIDPDDGGTWSEQVASAVARFSRMEQGQPSGCFFEIVDLRP